VPARGRLTSRFRRGAQGCPECGDGWRELLERSFAEIEAALAEGGTFRAPQIKQKHGTLSFYWSGARSDGAEAKVQEAINVGEARSGCTCEE
jgi:hypothetical protein